MKASPRVVLFIACICLFLSGMAGLVYEVIWARYLALFLGHTSYAVVAVLVAFMGGLALGNAWVGRLADQTARPLSFYAWLEIGIGAYALLFPFYFTLCNNLFVGLAKSWQPGSNALLAMKFAFSLLIVLLPTVLMGGTLPLLTRLVTRSLGELREKVAVMYFINSLGAVVGTWLADFWWIEAIGLEDTTRAGAALNLVAGAAALLASGWLQSAGRPVGAPARVEAHGESAIESPKATAPQEAYRPSEVWLALVAITGSGFVAMLYQVAWTRLLALALGSSTHAFSLMLLTFIAGIAAGSWLVYRWKRLGHTLTAFGWSELALAGSIAASMFLYQYLPYWFARLADLLARRPEAYPIYELLQGAVCVGVMFIPTLCLGMTLPLASRVATTDAGQAARGIGRVFAVNTVGTVLGAALTGLWLMPLLGLVRTFALGVGLNALIGLALLRPRLARRPWCLAAAPCVLLGWVLLIGHGLSPTWEAVLSEGLWRRESLPKTWEAFRLEALNSGLLTCRDGASSTVTVRRHPSDANLLSLRVNGKVEASTRGDVPTQLLIGHIPLLLHPSPREGLLVGLGSGMTAGAMLAHPNLQHLDVAEISPEVVEAARLFGDFNHHALDDRRMRVMIEDAKSFLQTTTHRYDVIVSEPSNPWMAGVAGVFSLEFYQHCRSRLATNGIMVQWIQLYEFGDAGLNMVLATFSQVFPFLSLWQGQYSDLFLVGSKAPLPVDLEAAAQRLQTPSVKADLDRVIISSLLLVLSHELVSEEYGAFIPPPDTRLHSDFYPTLEYVAQRDFFARPFAERFRQLDENLSRRPTTLLGRYLKTHPLTAADYEAFSNYYLAGNRHYVDLYASLLLHWQSQQPQAIQPLEISTQFKFLSAPGELDVLRLGPRRDAIFARAARQPALLRDYGTALMREYREQRSALYAPPTAELEAVLAKLIETDPSNQRVYRAYRAELAWDQENDDACLQLGGEALGPGLASAANRFKLDPAAPLRVVRCMAEVLLRRGELDTAAQVCEEAVKAGYLSDKIRYDALPFEVIQRKVLGRMQARQAVLAPFLPH